MGNLIIREAEPRDHGAIDEIVGSAWKDVFDYFRRTMGDELFHAARGDWQAAKTRQVIASCEGQGGARVYVAEVDGRVAGFVTSHVDERRRIGEIGNNAVHPEFQGRGIATRMYEFVLDEMRRRGCLYAKVSTGGDSTHAPARRAYEKTGFDRSVPHVTYWRDL